jgi:hypothetical protein
MNYPSRALNPDSSLEDGDVISSRLYKCIEMFWEENIPYSGPECGLGGFPTYECAVKYLSRISSAIKIDKSVKEGACTIIGSADRCHLHI